jgi:hypothetical protein
LKTLEIKVSVVAPNTSTKLVLVLPVASLVRVMMKASSEEALCPLVEKVQLSKL